MAGPAATSPRPEWPRLSGPRPGHSAGFLFSPEDCSRKPTADFVWDKEKLDRFIAKPDEVVPGNNMTPYGGLTLAEDHGVIVFLESPATN